MVAEVVAHGFDPLVEFYGNWTTELAEHYLPIPWVPEGTSYECVDGYLIMSPHEGTANGYAVLELATLLKDPARNAGHVVYPTVNVRFDGETWIQPDLTIMRKPVKKLTWVSADNVLLIGEMVSPSSKRRDRIDKPKLCAVAGIPYFLRVEIGAFDVHVEMLRLDGDRYVEHAKALGGQTFESDIPFPVKFDPTVLLEP